jgi:YHS domain-containing protein
MPQDLVCDKNVEGDGNRYFTDYNSDMYFFCSPECKRKFDDHPDEFIQNKAKEELGL